MALRASHGNLRIYFSAAVVECVALAASWLLVQGHKGPVGLDRVGFEALALPTRGWVADHASAIVDGAKVILGLSALALLVGAAARGARRACVAIVLGAIIGQTAAHIAKAAIERPRPTQGLIYAGGYSFPSTTSALGMSFLFLAFALASTGSARWRLIVAIGALVVLVLGLAFVALRVHYLSDVLAGWALGALALTACDALVKLLPSRFDR
jgi:membrane-associated phospholipid phosphatase